MTTRSEVLKKLVLTQHLNVSERVELGPLLKSEVHAEVLASFKKSGWFPPSARPWQSGRCVYEGYLLELLPDGKVRLWIQRGHSIHAEILADQRHWDFSDADNAIEEFVMREWPQGQIDGIALTK